MYDTYVTLRTKKSTADRYFLLFSLFFEKKILARSIIITTSKAIHKKISIKPTGDEYFPQKE